MIVLLCSPPYPHASGSLASGERPEEEKGADPVDSIPDSSESALAWVEHMDEVRLPPFP